MGAILFPLFAFLSGLGLGLALRHLCDLTTAGGDDVVSLDSRERRQMLCKSGDL